MSAPTLTSIVADAAVPLPAKPRVDREKCIVFDVLAIGRRSENGWEYPESFLETARHLLDGAACHWGHHFADPATRQPAEPPPGAKLGKHTNPVMKPDGWHTDIRYNPKNAHAEEFLWACENEPGLYGLSQLAKVSRKPELSAAGNRVADSYLALWSVDIVSRPASTSTIFDSADPSIDGTVPPPAPGSAPVALDPKQIAAQLTDAGAVEAFLKSLFDAIASIDPATKATVLEHLLAAVSGTAPDVADDGSADEAVADSLARLGPKGRRAAKLVRGVVAERKRAARTEWATKLIDAEALAEDLRSDVFVETVADCYGNESRAKALIADRAALAGGTAVVADSRDGNESRAKTSPPKKKQTLAEIAAGYSER